MQSHKISALVAMISLLSSCNSSNDTHIATASEVFAAYHAHQARGLSFDEDISYQSRAHREKISQRLTVATGKREGFIKLSLSIGQKVAQCGELTLADERIEGDTTYLVYDLRDICGDGQITHAGKKITMVFEDGWKIDENVTSF